MQFSYPDNLHPKLTRPLVEPNGWPRFSELASTRLELGFTRAQIAGAMNTYASVIGHAERGNQPITDRFRRRYERALEELVSASIARSEADAERTATFLAAQEQ